MGALTWNAERETWNGASDSECHKLTFNRISQIMIKPSEVPWFRDLVWERRVKFFCGKHST